MVYISLQPTEIKVKVGDTTQNGIISDQVSNSVTSSDESSSETLTESSLLVCDLEAVSTDNTESATTISSVNNTASFSEALQIHICTESEKSEPETTENITFPEESEDLKNEVVNDIASSVEEGTSGNVEHLSAIDNAETAVENVADSSTSQEEISESQDESLEDTETNSPKFPEVDETNSIDESVPEAKPLSEDIPMEVDIVTETESKPEIIADEPSSTSTDINL